MPSVRMRWSGGSVSASACSPRRCIGRLPSARRVWFRRVRERDDHRFALKLLVGTIGIWLIALGLLFKAAALPPEANGTVIVLFSFGTSSAEALGASAA